MEEFPLTLEGRQAGRVALWEENGALRAEATCGMRTDGLYRAYLTGERGEVLLGVLEPSDGRLHARRRISRGERERLGAVRGGLVRRSFSFAAEHWQPLSGPPPFADGRLSERAAALPGARVCRDGSRTRIAFPCAPERPFPLPELFCLARICAVEGERCAVYELDENGTPIF